MCIVTSSVCQIACPLCCEASSLNFLVPLCGRSIAAGTLSHSSLFLPSASRLSLEYPALAEQVQTLFNHFIEVNELDPTLDVEHFQRSISLAFSILILAK